MARYLYSRYATKGTSNRTLTRNQRATNVRPACGGPHSLYPARNCAKLVHICTEAASLPPHCGHNSPLHIVKKSKKKLVSISFSDIPISKNDKLTPCQYDLTKCLRIFAAENYTKMLAKMETKKIDPARKMHLIMQVLTTERSLDRRDRKNVYFKNISI